nr:MAG TPA: hypothetical protein [Caudoviricetes sp.]
MCYTCFIVRNNAKGIFMKYERGNYNDYFFLE